MKKTILTIVMTIVGLVVIGVVVLISWLYVHRISPIFVEREWRERVGYPAYTFEKRIHQIINNREIDMSMYNRNGIRPIGPVFNTSFDYQFDFMLVRGPLPQIM